jgi:KaiC/GvpD/RAD55 family RecA-like ATPase
LEQVVEQRRVTVLLGHFGSGKTEIALNRALDAAEEGERVTLADLDVVKPYFRSRAARDILRAAGVGLLAPEGENIFGDLPIIVPQIRSALREPGRQLVVDVGGDDTGARVLGSLADVLPRDETDVLLVLNFRRPSTPDARRAAAMVRAIERVGRVTVTGLISNTHLMDETTTDIMVEGWRLAEETAKLVDVPVRAVAVTESAADDLADHLPGCQLIRLRRIVRPPFEQPICRMSGPLFVVT